MSSVSKYWMKHKTLTLNSVLASSFLHPSLHFEQGAYKFGKIKFPEFSRFSRPIKQSFPYNYNVKTRCNEPPYQPSRYLSCSNAELPNIFLSSMVTGSTHASHCVSQRIYATVTKNYYAHKSIRHRNVSSDFQKFPEYISNFSEFSPSFPELKTIPVFSRLCRFSRVVSTRLMEEVLLPLSERSDASATPAWHKHQSAWCSPTV